MSGGHDSTPTYFLYGRYINFPNLFRHSALQKTLGHINLNKDFVYILISFSFSKICKYSNPCKNR